MLVNTLADVDAAADQRRVAQSRGEPLAECCRELYISDNQLSGSIPLTLGSLGALQ